MCGAVMATLEELERSTQCRSPNLRSIVERIEPAVETLLEAELQRDVLIKHAVRANIRASVSHLQHGSQVLEQLIQEDGLMIVGAEYSLETGVVEWFNTLPGIVSPVASD